ncbi:MAG TPA: dockerin type I domain-containing protein, partial [Candidatus Bathyarchaeia archaeon]|nr:dockerin type I domain-containing protein [Candidatus Bathyarchaeia archaeon]
EYPASDPLVTGVGGTTLNLNSNASYVSEQAWSGTGAGRSIVFAQPSWQKGLGDPLDRNSVDVSYVADPNSGVMVIESGSSLQVGGTSVGSPQWAALAALATEANRHGYGTMNPQLYKLTNYHDVLTGFNGYYSAGTGWDYPTGLGTPDAFQTVNALVSPLKISLNDTHTFQGVTVKTTGSLSVSQFTDILTGNTTVVARNSTTSVQLFSKTFTLAPIQMSASEASYIGSLTIGIPIAPRQLSSNIQVSLNSGNATATVGVTRRIDVNGDGIINILDLASVASDFGLTANNTGFIPSADIDGDGTITILDLAHVAFFFQSTDYI